MKLRHVAILFAGLLAAATWSAEASACGVEYRVVAGDSLSAIASRSFGAADRWLDIYEFGDNAEVIGSNPNSLQVGTVVALPPCDDEAIENVAIARDAAEPANIDPLNLPIEFLTASDWRPFTHLDAPGRGMVTQVIEAAYANSGLENGYEIDFIQDWEAHLETLLPKMKYDIGFPWFRPDCTKRDILSPSMAARCDLVWSDPITRVSIALYTATEANQPESFADLRGTTICRPNGYYTFDLEEEGLVDGETIELYQPSTVQACFVALIDQRVDYVSLNRFTAEEQIADLGYNGIIIPVKSLVKSLEMRAVAHPDNHRAADIWLPALNDGLRSLRQTGDHGRIVAFHQRDHRQRIDELTSN